MVMASSKLTASFGVLVLLPIAALGYPWNPFNVKMCDVVNCGKGTCVENSNSPFDFVCECDAGWKRTRLANEDNLKFLPCVIPNCSLDYSCMPAPPPLPPVPYNVSFFDPCYWTYCGGGTCTNSTSYDHICQCSPGYSNLMNISVYPCFSDCAIGADCAKLGVKVSSLTSTQGSSSDGGSHARSFPPGTIIWMAILATSLALVLKK
ncbi:uncharacterized protein LOC115743885 [Rhodamnia argentea]|uniref:Uncharacterized protein LOC115743885 n=1 Tax=Rhodamnia argentea TaxID=178133 RepID=A0A8B8PKN3_9MYRT|nr:uncharacterized protein LOC115743885 [Rhodamnia argentea]